jgi:hypothetical protein
VGKTNFRDFYRNETRNPNLDKGDCMNCDDREKSQIDKFREAARELETDDSEEAFDATLKKIAKAPPPKDDNGKRK